MIAQYLRNMVDPTHPTPYLLFTRRTMMKSVFCALSVCLLAGCVSTQPIDPQIASSSADFSEAETVEVKLSNFKFAPSTIELKAGQPYNLRLTGAASGGHDFTAPEFFAAAKVMSGDASIIRSGNVELNSGEAVTVRLIPAAGEYRLVCTHTGHAALGMVGKIIVR
jgi:uncharacterized cupredoxin-like copper-binding protein